MHFNRFSNFVLVGLTLCVAVSLGCNQSNQTASVAADSGKIPITTSSDEARKEFVQGRDLTEKLQVNDSLQHFDKAISLDANFAAAELARANASPTANEFFDHLNKAVALEDKTSEGEKLQIQAAQAGTNGDVVKQKEYLEKLVAAFPNDERAHAALGGYHFGQQEMPEVIEHYKKATELAPNYSIAYNMLGYAYRQQEDYANAEKSFKKYIELVPNDPNPYDSYAELLLKMGRYDESIAQYHKAMEVDPHWVPGRFGIAANLMYQNKWPEAEAELQKLADSARNDGELRTAYFGMAVVQSDAGHFDKALAAMDKEYAVAEKKNDVASMAADLQAKGNILAASMKYDEAAKTFDRSHDMIQTSSLSKEIKDNSTLLHHFNMAGIAIGKNDFAAAKTHTDAYLKGAEASKNPGQMRQAHELAGRIALGQKNYDTAISELQQANLQDPRNFYRLSMAYQGKGDKDKAAEFNKKAAEFNPLPMLPYAFIRTKVQKMAGSKA
ncbi:MAG TPA: tetratricopeptide repeat protein [Terriglobales bacterium]|nr:tetratricopeptide repeat protein [Terriglobales bacterium]